MIKFDIKNYPGYVGMHCTTEEDAKTFCKYLHSVGKKWKAGQSYLMFTYWDNHGEKTVYDFNNDTYGCTDDSLEHARTLLHFEDFDWSDFMEKKEFTKKDLKNGDVVLRRDGTVHMIIPDINYVYDFTNGCSSDLYSSIRDDLTSIYGASRDIVAVRRAGDINGVCKFYGPPSFAFGCNYGELVYERKEVEEMTLEEVCKALGKEIKIVKEK